MNRQIVKSLLLAMLVFTASPTQSASGKGLGDSLSIKLIDHTMIDTHNNSLQLVSDAMAEHIVVMNFIYTDCSTVCPVSTNIMKAVESRITEDPELRDKVRLITLTLNPSKDTPDKMKDYSQKHGNASDHWLWLTGKSQAVNESLMGLRAYTAELETHSSVILVGDPQTNHWTGFYQLPDPEMIVSRLRKYLKTEDVNS